MGTAVSVSMAEYLNTSYRPDHDWVEGELVKRNVGEYDHSNLQTALAAFLRQQQRQWGIRVLAEQRVRVSPTRFRIPDVLVISREQPIEPVFTKPPLVCIEVVSKDDTLGQMQERLNDYRAFGVPFIWVLDPVKQRAYVYEHETFREPENGILEVAGWPIRIPLIDLFADLD